MSLYKRFLVIFTLLEEQSLFHLQISHLSSGCFTQNGIIFFFSFAHFNEIVKPKCTTSFSKLLKGYISHVIKSSSIAYTFKNTKKKDFRNWEGEPLSKWWFIYKQLKKWQKEYYTDNLNWVDFCRRISMHALMFPVSLLKRHQSSY